MTDGRFDLEKKPVGNRSENRGHWPKGKRRNTAVAAWSQLRRRLTRLLAMPDRHVSIDSEWVRSRAGLARWLGVNPRTVGRWVNGDDMPPPENVERMREWIAHWTTNQSSTGT